MSFSTFQEIAAHMDGLGLFHVELGLSRMRRALAALDLERPPFAVVQIIGTNGKGSTAAFLAGLCRVHGCRAGLYTSPHFVSPEERIRVDGAPVPGSCWPALANAVMEAQPRGETLTYFEFLTVLALLLFREARVDVAILEAGLGGLHDATSAVAADLLCYTPVALDHAAILGPTLAHIARDKAGAMRGPQPVFSAPQYPVAMRELQAAAAALGAPLRVAAPLGPAWEGRLGLAGQHQRINAGLALAAWRQIAPLLGKAADDAATQARALQQAFLPGRLQHVPASSEWPELYLDGAHNPHGMLALLRSLEHRPCPRAGANAALRTMPDAGTAPPPGRALGAVLFSCLADKDWQPAAAMLKSALQRQGQSRTGWPARRARPAPILVPQLRNPRAARACEVAAWLNRTGAATATAFTGPDALAQALGAALTHCRDGSGPDGHDGHDRPALICGSLYLLAEFYEQAPHLLLPPRSAAEPEQRRNAATLPAEKDAP